MRKLSPEQGQLDRLNSNQSTTPASCIVLDLTVARISFILELFLVLFLYSGMSIASKTVIFRAGILCPCTCAVLLLRRRLASTMYVNQRAYFLSFPFSCSHQLFFVCFVLFLYGLFVGVGCCCFWVGMRIEAPNRLFAKEVGLFIFNR